MFCYLINVKVQFFLLLPTKSQFIWADALLSSIFVSQDHIEELVLMDFAYK